MVIDCLSDDFRQSKLAKVCHLLRVFVDGKEIPQVFYIDTEQGFVRTYDVLGDGRIHATRERLSYETIFAARSRDIEAGNVSQWDMPPDGIMSKTITGRVQLIAVPAAGNCVVLLP